MWIDAARPPPAPGCLKDGRTTEPPAFCSASRNSRSDAGSDGVLKSTSKAMSLTPAESRRLSRSAYSRRGHGQTPIRSMDGASIAITTIWPLAGRLSQAKRRSVSALRSEACQPDDTTMASAITTRTCGR